MPTDCGVVTSPHDVRLTTHDVEVVGQLARAVVENVGRVMVGKEAVVELALVAVLCEGHVLVEDVPGVGKTLLARSLARSLGCTFRRVQCTPDLLPADITGLSYFNQKTQEFTFRPGPIFANLVLADEVNRATPRTQAALLEAMEERQVTLEGESRPLPRPFLVLATQNPIEMEGTFPLPEAQLDRFLLRLQVGYPDLGEERAMLERFGAADPFADLGAVASSEDLLRAQRACQQVRLAPVVADYLLALTRTTRAHDAVELGASPRASLALARCARARAAIHGRPYVLPDDVKALLPHVLGHRLVLRSRSYLRGQEVAEVIDHLLASIPAPVEDEYRVPGAG